LGKKAANDTGLWIARLVAAPMIAASLAGIACSQPFDPFDAPIGKPSQPPRRIPAQASSSSAATTASRAPYAQRPAPQAAQRVANPWRAGDRFVEPAGHRQLPAPQQRRHAAVHASHSTQAAWQQEHQKPGTTEALPDPAHGELIEGEWTEGDLSGAMEFDGSWDGCHGCGDPACGCGGPCGGCSDGCGQCGGGGVANYRKGRVQYGNAAIHGWLAQGFTFNPEDPDSRFNGPLTFNDRANEYQLNQIYVAFEDIVDRCGCDWDLGGRVDILYGTDYFFTQARGLETRSDGSPRWNSADGPRGDGAALYGFAMPQLYAEVFAPFGDGLSVKMGHFYSILGYESVMYTQNFFYSHSYARQYGEPFTHTGLLADYRLGSNWTLLGGFTRGWDNWEDINGELGFLGGLEWCRPDGWESLRFALHTGNEDDLSENNRTVYSMVYYRLLDRRVAYVMEHNFGVEDNAAERENGEKPAHWYGITNYLVWHINCETEFGIRVEWFRDEENARVLGIPLEGSVGGNYVATTIGMNIYPSICEGLVVRPELRYDWSDTENESLEVFGMYDDFTAEDQFTIAISAALSF
jgi:hypothetical protein